MEILNSEHKLFWQRNRLAIGVVLLVLLAIAAGLIPRLFFGYCLETLSSLEVKELSTVVILVGFPTLCFLTLIGIGIIYLLPCFKKVYRRAIVLIGGGLLIFMLVATTTLLISNGGGWIWVGLSIIALCIFMTFFISTKRSSDIMT